MTIRANILLAYLSISLVGLFLAGALVRWLVMQHLEHSELERMSATLAAIVPSSVNSTPCAAMHRWRELRTARQEEEWFRVLSVEGIDFCEPSNRMNAASPEMIQVHKAARGSPVAARLTDRETGKDVLVAARPVYSGDGDQSPLAVATLVISTSRIDETVAELQYALILAGCLIVVIVTIATHRIARSISQPVMNVAHTARAIARGDVEQRVHSTSSGELAELAAAVNDMAQKLNSDIDRLRSLERVRSEFLGNVSHELRTPIFSIQGFLETLLDGAVDDPSVNKEFLGKAYRHAERLNTLLNDLIEISRIQSGEMKMSFRYFFVLAFMQQIADEMQGDASQKGIAVATEFDFDGSEQVYGDRDRLKQVMINLIDNALKYTESGGRITLRARRLKNQCEITVADTGCGIPEAHLTRIFERFYRVDRDRSREVGGTGLGLSIVKHIVEAHGGTIRAESIVGQGSKFIFTLKR